MTEFLASFFEKIFSSEAVIFILSLLPVSEIRGGMIFARTQEDVDLILAFIIAFIGNSLPIPFILLFLKRVFAFMRRIPKLGKMVDYLMVKAEKGSKKLGKYSFLGLFLLVAIPLPGTGGWTGALVADFVDMPLRKALPSIIAGIFTAGIIMVTLLYWLPGLVI